MDKTVDVEIDYTSIRSSAAKMSGKSIAGNSIMRSNFTAEIIILGRGMAEDYAEFFRRRGLNVLELNKHKD